MAECTAGLNACMLLSQSSSNTLSPQDAYDTYRCAAHKLGGVGENNFLGAGAVVILIHMGALFYLSVIYLRL